MESRREQVRQRKSLKDLAAASRAKGRKKSTVFYDPSTRERGTLGGKRRVWVPTSPDKMYELGFIDSRTPIRAIKKATVETLSGRTVITNTVYAANDRVLDDLTKLEHINEPCLLHNLEERAMEDNVYTWMGPVLIAVNPLKRLDEPCSAGSLDASKIGPHPFGLAENVITQLGFFKSKGVRKSQSIIISGESGSGKTVTAKLILKHIVRRQYVPEWGAKDEAALDEKMLDSNPILESFGNAVTLRNNNSSRFGKFFKLHCDEENFIEGGSLQTYLLERSRVTFHEEGERSFHVFYQLLAGCSKEQKKTMHLDAKFDYLIPGGSNKGSKDVAIELHPQDAADFDKLCRALKNVGVTNEEQDALFQLLAGILHLGNVDITSSKNGEYACVSSNSSSLSRAATLWGFRNPKDLRKLFCERVIVAAREQTVVPLSVKQAIKARDAIAKDLYARVFEWVRNRINASVDPRYGATGSNPDHFIGVLDVFGFESFERNDFEQLLINFANERLQASFNAHVLQAEADLYVKEGLTLVSKLKSRETSSSAARKLRHTSESPSRACASVDLIHQILKMVDKEAQNINPSDASLNKHIHDAFGNQPGFKQVHPSKRATCFTVVHFAGAVTYTVGNFLEKNDDSLPAETETFLSKSQSDMLCQVMDMAQRSSNVSTKSTLSRTSSKKGLNKPSVSSKFMDQMEELVETLDNTACSFVRCLKPNPVMRRFDTTDSEYSSKTKKGEVTAASQRPWFDRRYVSLQMTSLGVTQAALTLKDGLPIRMTMSEIIDTFDPIINGCVERVFLSHGESKPERFASAVLHAFDFPRDSYRIGLTTVFFQISCAEKLETTLRTMESWADDRSGASKREVNAFARKFSAYLIRRRWKRALLAVRFINRMSWSTRVLESQNIAATRMQSAVRSFLAKLYLQRYRKGAITVQRLYRGGQGRQVALARIATVQRELEESKEREKKERMEAEQKYKAEQARKKQEAEEAKQKTDKLGKSRVRSKREDQVKKASNTSKDKRDSFRFRKQGSDVEERKEKESKETTVPSKRFERVRKKSLAPSQLSNERFEQAFKNVELKDEVKTENVAKSYYMDDDELSDSNYEDPIATESKGLMHEEEKEDFESETDAEANCISVVARKLAVRSQSNWKKRYFVLNSMDRTISYFVQKGGKPKQGKVGVFRINPPDYKPAPVVLCSHLSPDVPTSELFVKKTSRGFGSFFSNSGHSGKYVIEVRGGKLDGDILKEDRSLFMSFDDFMKMEEWRNAVEDLVRPTREVVQKTSQRVKVSNFGDQVRCKNRYCGALNNTLYGTVCTECGVPLLSKR